MSLPEPSFIDRDPAVILAECVAFVELALGRVLLPAQTERILVDLIVYREMLLRIGIQEAAKQNLRQFASFPMLDYLAEIVGAARVPAQASRTTLRFTLPAPRLEPSPIDAGWIARTLDGTAAYATDELATIPTGETIVYVDAHATEAGAHTNGWAPGQVSVLDDGLSFEVAVANVTTTSGGAAEETTEQLRERFPLAVQAFSVAGPTGAYRALARAAHPDVIDVAVLRPTDGTVEVVVLSKAGVASPELLAVILAALDDEDVRPYTDTVLVTAAEPVDYEIVARLTLVRNARVDDTLAAAEAALVAYAAGRKLKLRQPPVESQMSVAASVVSVYAVEFDEPSPMLLTGRQWARCTGVNVIFDGYEPDEET